MHSRKRVCIRVRAHKRSHVFVQLYQVPNTHTQSYIHLSVLSDRTGSDQTNQTYLLACLLASCLLACLLAIIHKNLSGKAHITSNVAINLWTRTHTLTMLMWLHNPQLLRLELARHSCIHIPHYSLFINQCPSVASGLAPKSGHASGLAPKSMQMYIPTLYAKYGPAVVVAALRSSTTRRIRASRGCVDALVE